ncbi:MAG: hypothetical protein VR70_11915 [Rhodospirillaceae bacterium BRH_c57]|nr:MAG: hypothetical protein VR70_11915 [Rhodospirillaceae bacterium BRH_c57]
MTEFLTALALALAIEGAVYALFPGPMRRMIARVQEMPDSALRIGGVIACGLGVVAVWLIRL